MPDKDLSPFMPDFQGPLSGVLEKGLKPTPLEVPNPNARVGKLAATAAIASKFLEGVEAGRLRSFQNQQRERQQKRASVYRTYAQIQNDPRLTEDAKAQAAQTFRESLAGTIAHEADGGDSREKGKGKGKAGKDANGNPLVHFAKEFALGMVGGHMKGQPDIDVGSAIAKMGSVYDATGKPLPQYSLTDQRKKLGEDTEKALKGAPGPDGKPAPPPSSAGEARQRLLGQLPEYYRLYGKEAANQFDIITSSYPPGAKVDYEQDIAAKFKAMEANGVKMTPELKQEVVLGTFGIKVPSYNLQTGWAKSPDGKMKEVWQDPRNPGMYIWKDDNSRVPFGTEIVTHPPQSSPLLQSPGGLKDIWGNEIPKGAGMKFGTFEGRQGYVPVPSSSSPYEFRNLAGPNGAPVLYRINKSTLEKDPVGQAPTGTEYKVFTDPDGNQYAISVPKYQTPAGGGGGGKADKPKVADKPATADASGKTKKDEKRPDKKKPEAPKPAAAAPSPPGVPTNPFRRNATAAAPPPAEKKPKETADSSRPPGVPNGAVFLGRKMGNADRSMAERAETVLVAGKRLAGTLDGLEEKFPEWTGQWNGRKAQAAQSFDALPEDLRQIVGEVESVKSFLPSLHGLRGKYPIEAWEKTLGHPFVNPKATKGAIEGALQAIDEYHQILMGGHPKPKSTEDDPAGLGALLPPK